MATRRTDSESTYDSLWSSSGVTPKAPRLRAGGTLADGRFEIRGHLGEGGMGVVYEAFDLKRQQLVALKMLARADAGSIYRIKQEFRILSDVHHPNLIPLHELFAEDSHYFFTMDLVDGVPFDRWLNGSGGRVDVAALRHAFSELAGAVAAIHAAGKLHRDIKPSNALVTAQGHVVVLDFGLATDNALVERHQGEGVPISGTPAYMSPEQAAGKESTTASDWYAVGVMLFECLTGSPPFPNHSVLIKKLTSDPPSPASLVPDLPADLCSLCWAMLARDPARRPSEDTIVAVLGARPAGSERSLRPPANRSPLLFGREVELKLLGELFARSVMGTPTVALIRGDSGMGKSALLGTFLDGLRAKGRAVVLSGRCFERESVPYKAFDTLIDDLSSYLLRLHRDRAAELLPRDAFALAKLFPVLNRVDVVAEAPSRHIPDPHELQRRGVQALIELFTRMCDRQPVVISVDDLQWTDRDSVAILRDLLGGSDAPPLFFLSCARLAKGEEELLFAELPQNSGSGLEVREITLGPLPPEAAAALAHGLLSELEPRACERLARESGGSPLFVRELTHFARSQPTLEDIQPSLDTVLARRVLALPQEAQRLLEVVAVNARPTPQVLCEAALSTDGSLHGTVDLLLEQQLLRSAPLGQGRTLECYHDRVRLCVTQSLSAETVMLMHGRLADALIGQTTPDPEAISLHLTGAKKLHAAAPYAALAGRRAMAQLAFERAAEHVRFAVKHGRFAKRERRELQVLLGEALSAAGRGKDAAEAFLAAAAVSDEVSSLDLRRRAAQQLLTTGHMDDGITLIEQVLGELELPSSSGNLLYQRLAVWLRGTTFTPREEASIEPRQLARVDASWTCSVAFSLTDTQRGASYQACHLREALSLGEPFRVARALISEYGYQGRLGARRKAKCAALYQRACQLLEPFDTSRVSGMIAATRSMVSLCQGDMLESVRAGEEAVELLRGQLDDARFFSAFASSFRMFSLFALGELRQMNALLPELLADAERRGDVFALVTLASGVSYRIGVLAGDRLDDGNVFAMELRARFTDKGFLVQHAYLLLGELLNASYAGRYAEAHQLVETEWPRYKSSLLWRIPALHSYLLLARAGAALELLPTLGRGEQAPLLKLARREATRLEHLTSDFPTAQPMVSTVWAAIALAEGRQDTAAERLGRGVEQADADGQKLRAAALRHALGRLIGGDAGRSLVERGTATLLGEGVRDPARLAAVLAPGTGVAAYG